jgi:hypothetical protein
VSDRQHKWMPVYWGDYLSVTGPFDGTEHGACLLMMACYWHQGPLEDDDKTLARITRLSVYRFRKAKRKIVPRVFVVTDRGLVPLMVERWRFETFGRLPQAEWHELKAAVIARDGLECSYCGLADPDPHIDHVLALSRGGTNHIDNLVVSCWRCNLSKGAKTLEEWGGRA